MSKLEDTIEKVINEAALKAASGDSKPDADAEKHASDAAKKAGDATSKAKAPGGEKKGDAPEEVDDGETKVDKAKAVNQEDVEVDTDTPSLEEMSKADLLKAAVASMKEMDVKTLRTHASSLSEDEDGEDEEESESLSRNALIRKVVESLKDKSIKEVQSFVEGLSKEDDDEDQSEEEPEEEEEEDAKKESYDVDMSDDIDALVADEDLSEEFKTKAKTIFEAAVATRVREKVLEVETQYEEKTTEAIEEIKEDLSEKVDSYLNYVAESWVEENELAIERGLKSELTEDFINGLKKLFEEHYVEVPEDKFDVVEELAARLDQQEDKLNEEVAQNISLSQDVEELKREKIISEASKDLADSELEKLKTLAEDVDYEDEEKFQEKISTLKEAYFKGEKFEAVSDDSGVASSDTDPLSTNTVQNTNPHMSGYTSAISKFAKLDD